TWWYGGPCYDRLYCRPLYVAGFFLRACRDWSCHINCRITYVTEVKVFQAEWFITEERYCRFFSSFEKTSPSACIWIGDYFTTFIHWCMDIFTVLFTRRPISLITGGNFLYVSCLQSRSNWFTAGRMASRQLGLKRVRIIGVVVLSIGIFLTLFSSLTMIVIGLCVVCLGFFTAHSLTATSVSETATHHKGSASSLYLVSY